MKLFKILLPIILLLLIFLASCTQPDAVYRQVKIGGDYIVLKKEKSNSNYMVYLFNGSEANWYNITISDFDLVNNGDTLKNFQVETYKYFYEHKDE